MATGRTVSKFTRVYVSGYDLSGYSRSIGPLAWTFDEADGTTMGDEVKGALPNHPMINVGTLNAVLDNSSGASHDVVGTSQSKRVVMVPVGIRAEPAAGDPAFMGEFMQKDFYHETGEGIITISAPFSGWAVDGSTLLYAKPWGLLLHTKGTETEANDATGLDDNGAATARGGFMCYHLFSSDGTVAIKVQDAASNEDAEFDDLATSGNVDASSTPKSGIVALGVTATVRRYLRWQIALGTASEATFALGFVRVT